MVNLPDLELELFWALEDDIIASITINITNNFLILLNLFFTLIFTVTVIYGVWLYLFSDNSPNALYCCSSFPPANARGSVYLSPP